MEIAVVQIIKGKNFPPEGFLSLKVIWGAENVNLDRVSSSKCIDIKQEAAFKTSKDDERLEKSEEVLLHCQHISSTGVKSKLGVISISLEKFKSTEKWYTVVNGENLKTEQPTILVGTFFESSEEECVPSSPKSTTPLSKYEILKPILINDEYFCIGNPASVTAEYGFYTLSVTVSFAENLLHLFPSISLWPPENTSFQFRFNLFGNSIHLQPFSDLGNPISIGERATVKIQTSVDNLLDFFNSWMADLKIYLCCADITIAEMKIPIRDCIKNRKLETHILKRLDFEPLNISGIYPLMPLLEGVEEYNCKSSVKPQVGVVFLLSSLAQQTCEMPSPNPPNVGVPISKSSESLKPTKDVVNELDQKNQDEILYATVLELEIWKEEQKMIQQQKLQQSSHSHLGLLNDEYRRQVSKNEAAFQIRIQRVEELEQQLESAILTMRRREQDLIREKEHISRIRSQIQKEKNELATEVDRITLRLKAEHQCKIDAERRRHSLIANELRQKHKATLNDIAENHRRILELEQELESVKKTN